MRIGGLASGMDIDQLVSDLMKAEKLPLDKLTKNRQLIEWQKEAYRDINLSLSELRQSASNIRFQSSYHAYSMTSSNQGIVTAEASGSTTPGNYTVTVNSLAASAKLNSENAVGVGVKSTDLVGEGQFTITTAKGTTTIDVTNTDTYASVATKMQNSVDETTGDSLGIRANFDSTTSRFFMSTKGMGAAESITISGGLADQLMGGTVGTYSAQGVDGSIDFDGIPVTGLTSNTVTVNGMKLTLTKADPTTTVNISVQTDTEAPVQLIKDFVKKYNEVIEKIQGQLVEPKHRDYLPLTDEEKAAMSEKQAEMWEEKARSGLLRNDPILQTTLNNLRKAFMDPVAGIATGEINMLTQIGINTGNYREGGKLFIDDQKLKQALETNPDEVMNLFTKNDASGKGIGERLYSELNKNVKILSDRAGSPTTLVDNSTLSKRITQMNEAISTWETRLTKVEDRYWRQFTAMEKALNQMNSQSSWMQQNMFGGM